ncbi:glycosyl hydrolase family 28-related protein [Spirochaetota bacterium]
MLLKKTFCLLSFALLFIILTGCKGSGKATVKPEDLIIDRGNVGIPGGIPDRSNVCADVQVDYGAQGDGSTDDGPSINAAIQACPENQVVYIPAGTYRITSPIIITKSIVLRGDGNETRLEFDFDTVATYGISIGDGDFMFSEYIDVESGYKKGSDTITLKDASSIEIGDYLVIDQENDSSLVTSKGAQGDCTWCGLGRCTSNNNSFCNAWDHGRSCDTGGTCEGGKRTLGHMVKVIGKNNNTLTLEIPLLWNFKGSLDPQVIERTGMIENVGIEDLYITQTGSRIRNLINIYDCSNCWIKNIEAELGDERMVDSKYTYRNEYRDNYFHHAYCYTGNHGAGFNLQGHTTANLVENNVFNTLHDVVFISSGGGGNVVAYNYSTNSTYEQNCGEPYARKPLEFNFHGAHPVYNLFEGNVVNSMGADFIWGSSSHNILFRNRVYGYGNRTDVKWKVTIKLEKLVRNFYMFGNILGIPDDTSIYEYEHESDDTQCNTYNPSYIYFLGHPSLYDCSEVDPVVEESLVRHGNYDYTTGSVIWDSEISSQELPNSLYLDAKPEWFGDLNYPPFGPDSDYENNKIPAQVRFEQMTQN